MPEGQTMQVTVKSKDGQKSEYTFHEDPINIGRGTNNQIYLPDRSVSKQHAVIFSTEDNIWMVQDLDSANKTYLNGQSVNKTELKSGDTITITNFSITVSIDENPDAIEIEARAEDTVQLEASLNTPRSETVIRKPDAGHAPAMRLPAKRLTDFAKATDELSQSKDIEELLLNIIKTVTKQFSAFHVWCALRESPNGPMTYHTGKRRDGKAVELSDIPLADKINNAVEKGQSIVLPRVSAQLEKGQRIRSALIVAISNVSGCYGVIYVDNAMVHEHYSLSDLDYLMFMAMHIASTLKCLIG